MSTKDVENYFKRYIEAEDENNFKIIWINDSSCVIKINTEDLAQKAYKEIKLSEPRTDDMLPPLDLYL